MKVAIEVNGEVIWYRDSDKQEGMASVGYLRDGTQQKIIAALEESLFQAKGQLNLPDDGNAFNQ
ncbi:Rrf2 family transcriptional regulator [Klebsiella michiganensis]|uniref:Rrf2 family transcriptional regulator n=1 Tax=Klebsiella michiganensis TaxID=1134687 RepID=UPI003D024DB9